MPPGDAATNERLRFAEVEFVEILWRPAFFEALRVLQRL